MKPNAQIEYKPLSELHELPGNPRTIKKDQFEKLKTSLRDNADYFEARPLILSDRTGELVILAGNQRYKAAKAIGLTEVPTITLHGLTEEREREIVIRDNVNNGDWDFDALANEWEAATLDAWGVKLPVWDDNTTEYQQFVDKFKPKLTQDWGGGGYMVQSALWPSNRRMDQALRRASRNRRHANPGKNRHQMVASIHQWQPKRARPLHQGTAQIQRREESGAIPERDRNIHKLEDRRMKQQKIKEVKW